MKKLLAFVLAFVLLLGLVACGKAIAPVPSTTQPDVQTEAAAPRPEDKPSRMTSYNRDGTLHFTMTYEYGERENTIRSEQHLHGSIIIYTYKNSYNEKGQLEKAEIQTNGGDDGFITYEYNADGQLTEHVYTDTSFGEFSGRMTYTYNEQGQLIQTVASDGTERSTFEYDARGLKVRENIYYGDSEDTLSRYYIYEYD